MQLPYYAFLNSIYIPELLSKILLVLEFDLQWGIKLNINRTLEWTHQEILFSNRARPTV